MNDQYVLEQKHMQKLNSARLSLILVFIFSIVNVFSICFTDTYFLFSSYFSQMLAVAGYQLYAENGQIVVLVVLAVVAAIISIPYLLCGIFMKKHVGWLIAALILFGLDTAMLLIDCILTPEMLAAFAFDIIIHGIVVLELAVAIRAFKKLEVLQAERLLAVENGEVQEDDLPKTVEEVLGENQRTITVNRKNALPGGAVKLQILIDGYPVAEVKNGKTVTIPLNGDSHTMSAVFVGAYCDSNGAEIPVGEEDLTYTVVAKMKGLSFITVFEQA